MIRSLSSQLSPVYFTMPHSPEAIAYDDNEENVMTLAIIARAFFDQLEFRKGKLKLMVSYYHFDH